MCDKQNKIFKLYLYINTLLSHKMTRFKKKTVDLVWNVEP